VTPLHYALLANVAVIAVLVSAYARERLRAERAWALYRQHLRAQAVATGQVWILNDRPIFIIRTDADGVGWSIEHPLDDDYTPQRCTRYETWNDWRRRIARSDVWLTRRDWGAEDQFDLRSKTG
jgi:hypothetical protein